MDSVLVSIVIPTYNRENYLEQAISSVAEQTYSNIEIIVVDDGSVHNYAESICDKYNNCYYFYKKNGGLSSARNYGINKAKGEYIAFLDDDDFWKVDKIEKQVELLENFPKIDCVHSSAIVVNETGQETGQIIGASQNKIHKRSGNVFWNALGVWVVKSPTPLIRKNVFQPDLMFDETIKVGEDVDFYQRLFYRHKVFYINEPLAYYREYKSLNRLSLDRKKYIGIEKKMYFNFLKMGMKNQFVLYLIARKLVLSYFSKWNSIHNEKKKVNVFKLFLTPLNYLKSL